MVKRGRMRFRMTVEKLKTQESGFEDGPPDDWQEFVQPRRFSISPLRGEELLVADQMRSQVTHNGRCRYFAGADSSLRLKYGDRIFHVESVVNEFERNRFLVWKLVEVEGGS